MTLRAHLKGSDKRPRAVITAFSKVLNTGRLKWVVKGDRPLYVAEVDDVGNVLHRLIKVEHKGFYPVRLSIEFKEHRIPIIAVGSDDLISSLETLLDFEPLRQFAAL